MKTAYNKTYTNYSSKEVKEMKKRIREITEERRDLLKEQRKLRVKLFKKDDHDRCFNCQHKRMEHVKDTYKCCLRGCDCSYFREVETL